MHHPTASLNRFIVALCALLLLPNSFAQEANEQVVMVPMRDGVNLATNIYLPEGDGPWPVVLTRTPYDKNRARRSADLYNENGYALVSQDVRGRYESEGIYQPFEVDMPDGYDTVEWIAAQDFSNGKIGIFGTWHYFKSCSRLGSSAFNRCLCDGGARQPVLSFPVCRRCV